MVALGGSIPRLLRVGLIAGLVTALLAAPFAYFGGRFAKAGSDAWLSMPGELREPAAAQTTYVYAADGITLLAMFYAEHRKRVPLGDISPNLINAIIAAEDSRFFSHNGVDPQGLARAFVANQKANNVEQGASTITMQYVRMALRDGAANAEEVIEATEQSNERKLREIRLAIALEHRTSKEDILERYLNSAYFGHRAYGAYSAAEVYFSKHPKDLTLAEAALLAGLVKAPTDYDPASQDQAMAKDRRDYVLRELSALGLAAPEAVQQALQEPLRLSVSEPPNDCVSIAPEHNSWGYFCDFFKNWWLQQEAFGENPQQRLDTLRTGGYRVVSTLDPAIQNLATAKVMEKEPATSSFAHGVVALEPGTGKVKAMAVNRVYSVDQSHNGPHSAPGATRPSSYPNTVAPLLGGGNLPGYQAGSTFKMFTMVAALEKGLPLTWAVHAPQRYASIFPGTPGEPSTCGGVWCPVNASAAMTGTHTMWSGFGKSVNTYFVQLEQAVGVPDVVRMAERLGLRWRSPVDFDLATNPARTKNWGAFTLGVADTTPLEMAGAYATLAAQGVHCDPQPVQSLTNPDGTDVPVPSGCEQTVSPAVANAATDAARCVTGYKAAGGDCGDWSTAPGVYGAVGRPVAGKTGTTDDTRAAWFVGYTPQLAAASFIADPDYPFHLAGDGNAWKPITTVSEVLRDGLAGQPVAQFTYP